VTVNRASVKIGYIDFLVIVRAGKSLKLPSAPPKPPQHRAADILRIAQRRVAAGFAVSASLAAPAAAAHPAVGTGTHTGILRD